MLKQLVDDLVSDGYHYDQIRESVIAHLLYQGCPLDMDILRCVEITIWKAMNKLEVV